MVRPDTTASPIGPDRRSLLVGLAALIAAPAMAVPAGAAAAAPLPTWSVATQIVAGTLPRDRVFAEVVLDSLVRTEGADVVEKLFAAILARDADDIGRPFEDPAVEAAARAYVERLYTGEVPQADGGAADPVGFHQALAWQVLRFTKAPSVCGPGFGWWTDPPDVG